MDLFDELILAAPKEQKPDYIKLRTSMHVRPEPPMGSNK
jgi:hypothetical protein